MWEKRYRILSPARSDTNIRKYSDEDLKKIINISLLNTNGIKISKLAGLSAVEISEKVSTLSESTSTANVSIDQLVLHMIDLDEAGFVSLFDRMIRRNGFEETITGVIYPFLEKIGVLWQTGHILPAQEHFISNLIRQKLVAAVDREPAPGKSSVDALFFLPDNELHELGLLFYHWLARKRGVRTFYLGQRVPYSDIVAICQTLQPRILVTHMTSIPEKETAEKYLARLCADNKGRKVIASGLATKSMAAPLPANLRLFSDPDAFKKLLT